MLTLKNNPNLAPEIPVQTFRDTIKLGRGIISDERRRSRLKALRYAKKIRSRGFNRGYQAGLAAAQGECLVMLQALRGCYEDAVVAAKSDTIALATALAERIVDTTLLERPEVLLAWIEEGLGVLKRSRSLHLSFQPRYQALIEHIQMRLPDTITAEADASLSDSDFVIRSEIGGVEFSWRSVLKHPEYCNAER
jgi:flagellar biosynthesis/type III secretory pathway protein FliH